MKKQPFNLQLKNNFLKYSKECKKKLIKRKRNEHRKELFDKLMNLRETDPKQYWKLLKTLKYEDESPKTSEIQDNFVELADHFKSQGETHDFDEQ